MLHTEKAEPPSTDNHHPITINTFLKDGTIIYENLDVYLYTDLSGEKTISFLDRGHSIIKILPTFFNELLLISKYNKTVTLNWFDPLHYKIKKEEIIDYQFSKGNIEIIQFVEDKLAILKQDQNAVLIDLKNYQYRIIKLDGNIFPINDVEFIARENNKLKLYSVDTSNEIWIKSIILKNLSKSLANDDVHSMALSPNKRYLAVFTTLFVQAYYRSDPDQYRVNISIYQLSGADFNYFDILTTTTNRIPVRLCKFNAPIVWLPDSSAVIFQHNSDLNLLVLSTKNRFGISQKEFTNYFFNMDKLICYTQDSLETYQFTFPELTLQLKEARAQFNNIKKPYVTEVGLIPDVYTIISEYADIPDHFFRKFLIGQVNEFKPTSDYYPISPRIPQDIAPKFQDMANRLGFFMSINKLSEKEKKEKKALDFLTDQLESTSTSLKSCVDKTKEKFSDLVKTKGYLYSSLTPIGKLFNTLSDAKETKHLITVPTTPAPKI